MGLQTALLSSVAERAPARARRRLAAPNEPVAVGDGGAATVARSYDPDITKGGHADMIPIASELIPSPSAA